MLVDYTQARGSQTSYFYTSRDRLARLARIDRHSPLPIDESHAIRIAVADIRRYHPDFQHPPAPEPPDLSDWTSDLSGPSDRPRSIYYLGPFHSPSMSIRVVHVSDHHIPVYSVRFFRRRTTYDSYICMDGQPLDRVVPDESHRAIE